MTGIRFRVSVHHGDTLYAESTVLEARPSASRPHAGVVRIETRGRNQEGTLVTNDGYVLEPSITIPSRSW